MKNKIKWLMLTIIVLIVFYAFKAFNIGEIITLENLILNKNKLSILVKDNYYASVGVYILAYVLVVTLNIPGAAIMSLAGGFLFGAVVGTIYIDIAATIGALLSFVLARYLLGGWIQEKYENKLLMLNKELNENGVSYMFSLRLIPIFPFALINVLAGLTNLSVRDFFITTVIGIIPGAFVYSYAGSSLYEINSVKDILSVEIITALVLLGLLSLVPVILKKIKRYKLKSKNDFTN